MKKIILIIFILVLGSCALAATKFHSDRDQIRQKVEKVLQSSQIKGQ